MATAAEKAFGTKLYIGGSGTPKTGGTVVEEVVSLSLPKAVAKLAEVTNHDSTSAAGEHISTYYDEGEVGVTMNYKAATEQEVVRGLLNGAPTQMYINFPGGTGKKQLDFMGIVSGWDWGSAGPGDALQSTATVKITGPLAVNTQG